MQLPDEAIVYHFQTALVPAAEEWTAAAELRASNFLSPAKLRDLAQRILQVRSQVAAERELRAVPAEMQPHQAGFIDLPQKLLDQHRRQGEASTLGRVLAVAGRLREQVDRVVVVGSGGAVRGARVLFEALRSSYHNELPVKDRPGLPRVYFDGDHTDNDALNDLLQMLQINCVDPDLREERWGCVVVSKSGETLETLVAYRTLRRELAEFYGTHSPRAKNLVVPITGTGGKLRALLQAEGYPDENILTIPDDVGSRFAAFTPAGLLPAAVMHLDVRALLLGAAAMTRRFLEEPFERNPVLQYAAINYLATTECRKPIRVLSIWSKKLAALGPWYEQLLAESLGKQGQGPTPLTMVQPADQCARGQQHREGPRDKFCNHVIVKSAAQPPITVGMADRNQDDLNQFNRKGLPDLTMAAFEGVSRAAIDAARPAAQLVVPTLSEHAMGQFMQMLMLATVVEARLLGVNPYSQPGVEPYRRHQFAALRAAPANPA